MNGLTAGDRARIQGIIEAHAEELRAARGVVRVAPGFPVAGGRLLREPAILVFVRRKLGANHLAGAERLPRQLEEVRVDVLQAPADLQIEALAGPIVGAVDAEALAVREPTYEPIAGDPIDEEFELTRPLLCHVGPDAGWVVLRDFLAGTRRSLVVAMYDFNAEYIANALIETVQESGASVALALDDGIDDRETTLQEKLQARLADAYDPEVVVCRADAAFPTAYHEKVAVRDGRTFWISSGNWSLRSQPEIDPVGEPATAQGMYSKGNREWHLIVDHAPLAKLFGRYIEHDRARARAQAQTDVVEPAAAPSRLPDLFVPIDDLAPLVDASAVVDPVKPVTLPSTPRTVRVQPVLSPDNYARRVDELVRSATARLYLQYAYITWRDTAGDAPFAQLLRYLGQLSWRDDFDLRVIVGAADAQDKVRVLVESAGWSERVVRAQGRLHNKGIVADGERVLVSSQNWSSDGFLRNRGAGLIVHDAEVAAYYEGVFLDDWEARARSPFVDPVPVMLARPGEAAPPGMARVSWAEYAGA